MIMRLLKVPLICLALNCAGQIHVKALRQSTETPTTIRAKIEALRSPNVAWRQIPWKSCLLDGLRESREKKKPLMLWIFIDRPADDARC
jgi:hypothetical protein